MMTFSQPSIRALGLVFLGILTVSRVSAQGDPEPTYDYPTILKGGFEIVYTVDAEFQYLHLKKGKRIIKEVASTSRGLLHKNLGYVGADFMHSFALVHSYGSGNPHRVELIRKRDGKDLFAGGSMPCLVDASERRSILITSDDCVPEVGDRIRLLNVLTGEEKYLSIPGFMFSENEVLSRIEIISTSARWLSLKFTSYDRSKIVVRKYRL